MPLPALSIGGYKARYPVIQGGMGVGISLSSLASAVAREGGVGVISAAGIGMLEPDFNRSPHQANQRALRAEIRRARSLGEGIIGINAMVALSDFDELIRVSVEEEADLIIMGAGLPLKAPELIPPAEAGRHYTCMVPIVSSARATQLILKYWAERYNRVPDAIVVEGPLAGGHLGFKPEQLDDLSFSLQALIPQVIAAVEPYREKFGAAIPVIAAGGIYTGADIHEYLNMGAAGVQMATRFVTTVECDASDAFKNAFIECREEDLVIIKSPVGLPGRAIKNKFLEAVEEKVRRPFACPWKCLKTCDFKVSPYCICRALTNAKKGFLDKGFAFAGANAYLNKQIISVKELFAALVQEYEAAASSF
ncbi:MAG: nitronate monooxygenase family protein [Dehalococcoidales bacterium]|jgi:NAD(P)H-dependent flavin oxidoreductase YrpB (nitropropane dioxygenase family)|nr:nitronate monooxygenase family protein [Dehalococcoidales bacterium]MDX9803954.1 nitronate monooxygenase family protein [Dehalococcoidales bacterium]